jgi:hypothetical protein
MWCWGCDVRRAEGNLLLAYGFEKRASPNPRYHSAYTLRVCATCALTVWGWGLWVAHADYGSAFISRSRFNAAYTPDVILAPCAWQADELPLPRATGVIEPFPVSMLLMQVCRCAACYETWLLEQVGVGYRESVSAAWPERRRHRGGTPAERMAQSWLGFAGLLAPI